MTTRATQRFDTACTRALDGGQSVILTGNTVDLVVAADSSPRRLKYHLSALAGDRGMVTVEYLQSIGGRQLPLPGRPPAHLRLPGPGDAVLDAVERLFEEVRRSLTPVLIIVEYGDLALPVLGGAVSPDQNRTLELIAEFVADPQVTARGHRLVVVAKTGAVDDRLHRLPGFTVINVELPDHGERLAFIERALHPAKGAPMQLADGLTSDDLANLSGGLQLNDLARARAQSLSGSPIGRDWVQAEKAEALRRSAGESLTVYPSGGGFNDIAGLPQVRRIVEESRDTGLVPRRILFCGPPGVGKTLCVTAVADELGLAATALGNVRSMWVGESERNLGRVIDAAEALAPVVLHIDEIDQAIGPRQTGQSADGGTSERLLGRIMTFLGSNTEKRITVIATSNRPDLLDPAMFDRFTIVPVLHPTPPEAAHILDIAARKEGRCVNRAQAEAAVRKHNGLLTGRVLVEVLDRAMTFAAVDGSQFTIEQRHLDAAFDDLQMAVDPLEHERLALLAISLTTFKSYLPWEAAHHFGMKPELPPYLPPLLDGNGRIDQGKLRNRLEALAGHHGAP